MSHPDPRDEGAHYKEDGVTHYPKKKNRRLSDTVQGWAHSMMSPHEKALSKSKRRQGK